MCFFIFYGGGVTLRWIFSKLPTVQEEHLTFLSVLKGPIYDSEVKLRAHKNAHSTPSAEGLYFEIQLLNSKKESGPWLYALDTKI